ncbi:MAG: pilus (MSHA type) biogenesis protein MshL [Helicobacteraceae bacterium]|nr:pilus (MSHA type) biogenesis protein MshL [Helicobacteraceae bacterium]
MRALRALTIAFALAVATYAACPGERFDVSIKEPIGLKDALLSIIDECDLSLSLEGEGTQAQFESAQIGYVTLRAVSADEAVDFFLQRANLHGTLVNDLLTIRYLDTRLFRVDFVNNSRSGSSSADVKIGTATGSSSSSSGSDSSSSDSTTTIKTEEKFDLWTTLGEEIGSILNRPEDGAVAGSKNSVFVNPTSGLVSVTGTRRQIDRVSEYLDKLLTSLKKQVLIDVQIYEVLLEDENTSGIDWSALSINFGDSSGGGTVGNYHYNDAWTQHTSDRTVDKGFIFSGGVRFNAAGMFNFLKTQGETRSLSNPKVLAMNNQPTLISVGRNLNYQTLSSTTLSGSSSGSSTQSAENDSLFVGVLLDITPQIDEDGYITLRLNPSFSDLVRENDIKPPLIGTDTLGNDIFGVRQIAPDTKSHRISSVVRVRDRDVIVLGGLIDTRNDVHENKIPLLGDIPFLGKLFGSKTTSVTNREIVFVLTPSIVVDNKPQPSLKALGFSESMLESIKEVQVNREPKLKEFDDE